MRFLRSPLAVQRDLNAKHRCFSPRHGVKSMTIVLRFALLAPLLLGLGGCFNLGFLGFGGTTETVPPAERQLPASTQALLAIKGMKLESPSSSGFSKKSPSSKSGSSRTAASSISTPIRSAPGRERWGRRFSRATNRRPRAFTPSAAGHSSSSTSGVSRGDTRCYKREAMDSAIWRP